MKYLRDCIKKYDLDVAAGLTLLTLAVYVRIAWHDFINLDDTFFVTMNENIQDGLTLKGIQWAFTTPYQCNWIPLTWISHMLDIQLFGLNAGAHHIVNVLLHTASTLLLFGFINMTTGEKWKSGMVAFLFALHPLHIESVAWVAERKGVLSAFFWTLALCIYASYVRRPGLLRYSACLIIFLMGLLAKPMLITLPLIFLLLDFWPLERLGRIGERTDFSNFPRLLAEKLPFVILAVSVSVITYITQKTGGAISENYTFASRAGKALTYYVAYLEKTMWPSGLSILYPISLYPPSFMKIMGAAMFLAIVTITALIFRQRHRYLITGWMWYIITLTPVIGLVQIGLHSITDRYTYIPLIGIFIMTAWGIPELMGNWCMKVPALRLITLALVAIMVVVTSYQLGHWKNSITLFSHAIDVTERNDLAYKCLGSALLDLGKAEEAIHYFQLAVVENPSDTFSLINMGAAYRRISEHEKALDAYSRAVLFEPENEHGHYGLALVYLDTGQKNLAIEEYHFLRISASKLSQELLTEILRH